MSATIIDNIRRALNIEESTKWDGENLLSVYNFLIRGGMTEDKAIVEMHKVYYTRPAKEWDYLIHDSRRP